MSCIIVSGYAVPIPDTYTAGTTLSAAEASALNGLRRDRIRMNLSKALAGTAFSQAEVTERALRYAQDFVFSLATESPNELERALDALIAARGLGPEARYDAELVGEARRECAVLYGVANLQELL